MKKRVVSFISLVMVLLMAFSTITIASADEGATIGGEANDAAFWTVFSDIYAVPAGQTVTADFTNYTDGATNWNNFLVVLQSTATGHSAAEAEGYSEYAVLRADNFGWGAGYSSAILESNWDWTTFTDVMNGAKVAMSVTNYGDGYADVLCNITTADGAEHFQNYKMITVTGDLYFCLTLEKARIDGLTVAEPTAIPAEQAAEHDTLIASKKAAAAAAANKAKTQQEEAEELLSEKLAEDLDFEGLRMVETIGNRDLSTGWWGDHSQIYAVQQNGESSISFINHNKDNSAAWNNFVVVLQNTPTGHSAAETQGYKEYGVVRSDNYGWNAVGNTFQNLPALGWYLDSNWDWENYRSNINGANVQVEVMNNGDTADILIRAASTEGKEFYQLYKDIAIDGDLYYCVSVDGSCLEVIDQVTDVATIEGVVGNQDNTSAWWTAFSQFYEVEEGETVVRTFKNYSDKAYNWNNFAVELCSTAETPVEYAICRADNFGVANGDWENQNTGDCANKPNWVVESNWDWANFTNILDGATVEVTVTNNGTTADVYANVLGSDNNTYYQNYKGIQINDGLQFRFTTGNGHLEPVNGDN